MPNGPSAETIAPATLEPNEQAPGTAWGLRIAGPDVDRSLLGRDEEDFPLVKVTVTVGEYTPVPLILTADEAQIDLFGEGCVRVHRASGKSELYLSKSPSRDQIVHPLLASTAVVMNHWLGRVCLHAGAMIVDGGAWGLLGHRTHGKSSSLGWLAAHELPILTDDVLAIDEGQAYAGPRCLDLRREAAQRLGIGRELGRVGVRERWRVQLKEIAPRYPLRGLIFLDWGESVELFRIPARDVISRLFDYLAMRYQPDALGLLELASLPAWQWRRPQSWDSMDSSMASLLQTLRT